MKRLVFAFAVLALVACAKQEAVPAADTTAVAPAAAPAAVDTTAVAVPADTTKR
jgi:tripartite-type tricarboxylate transporter receptor subunit TctC